MYIVLALMQTSPIRSLFVEWGNLGVEVEIGKCSQRKSTRMSFFWRNAKNKKHGKNTNHKKTDTTNKANSKSNSTFREMKEKKGNIYDFERIQANQMRRSSWKGQARKE